VHKFVDDINLNLIVLPLTPDEAISLEGYLTETVVVSRGKDEFVVVLEDHALNEFMDESLMTGFSWVSYGRYDKTCLANEEKIEIEKSLLSHGRQWLKDNDFEIFN
jgi:hypothetical protein